MATELERLVVKIEADLRDLKRGLRGAEQATARSNRRMAQSTTAFTGALRGLRTTALAVAPALGAIAGIGAVGLFTSKAIQNTVRQERALRLVENRLRLSGNAVGFTTDQLAAMAAEFQRTTRFGDEAVLELQAQLLSFGNITGEVFERTIAASLDMAEAFNREPTQAMRTLALAINDPATSMGRLKQAGISLDEEMMNLIKTTQEQEGRWAAQVKLLEAVESSMGGAAVAAANTLGGALDQLSNAFNDLFENTDATPELTAALQDLKNTISDPAFVANVQKLTAAMFDLTTILIDSIDGIVNWSDTWINRIGAAIDAWEEWTGLDFEILFDPIGNAIDRLGELVPEGTIADIERLTEELRIAEEVLDSFDPTKTANPALQAAQERVNELRAELAALNVEAGKEPGRGRASIRTPRRTPVGGEAPATPAAPSVPVPRFSDEQLEAMQEHLRRVEEIRTSIEQQSRSIQNQTELLRIQLRFRQDNSEEMRVALAMEELRQEFGARIAATLEDEVRERERVKTLLDEQTRQQQELVRIQEVQIETTNEATSAAIDLDSAIGQFAGTATSAFEDAIIAGEDFKTVLEGLEDDIMRLLTRILILEPIEKGLRTGLGAFVPPAGPGGPGGLEGVIGGGLGSLADLFPSEIPGVGMGAFNRTVGQARADVMDPAFEPIFGSAAPEIETEELESALASVAEIGEEAAAGLSGAGIAAETAGSAMGGDLVPEVFGTVAAKATETATTTTAATALGEFTASVIAATAALTAMAAAGSAGSAGSAFGPQFTGTGLEGLLSAGSFHKGGVVGKTGGPRVRVPASVFARAPRMHDGGVAGLRADEVPAILQTGERVIPRDGVMGGGDIHLYGVQDFQSFKRNMPQFRGALFELRARAEERDS